MIPHITEAEERVLRALWDRPPMTLGEITSALSGSGWTSKTIKTLLSRLCDKGAVGAAREERHHRYTALVTREQLAAHEIGNMAERLFEGSAKKMLAFFCQTNALSPEEAQEMIALLESGKESE